MIDNFSKIRSLLSFNSEDEFYFIQIIQRKKENPATKGRNNNNRLIKAYTINSFKEFNSLEDEMKGLADYFNARIGINLNKRSFEKTAFNTQYKIAKQMLNRDFRNVKSAYHHSCGIHNAVEDKIWILDVDYNPEFLNLINHVEESRIIKYLYQDVSPTMTDKFICRIPSKSGVHLITKPFNSSQFQQDYPEIEIHKNNPTNLYIP